MISQNKLYLKNTYVCNRGKNNLNCIYCKKDIELGINLQNTENMKAKFLNSLFILLLSVVSKSQSVNFNDVIFQQVDNIKDSAKLLADIEMEVVNGYVSFYKYPPSNDHPYFMAPIWQEGSIITERAQFTNKMLRYDLVTDNIFMNLVRPGEIVAIALHKEAVERFTIGSYKFVQVDSADAKKYKISPGFYEEIFNQDSIRCLRKWFKVTSQEHSGFYTYHTKERIFIIYRNKKYTLATPIKLGRIFPEQRQNLRAYRRQFKHPVEWKTSENLSGLFEQLSLQK